MADDVLTGKLSDAVWVAHSLFDRGKTSGSSANMSFIHNGKIYITRSGACFGTLAAEDFVPADAEGTALNFPQPSKELPLHRLYYAKSKNIQAVIHTHGPYATLWSCRRADKLEDIIPHYTPYLEMKVGKIALVPYAAPGSQALFDLFKASLDKGDAFLLKNHGAIVGGKTIMDAFYGIEELEESAKIACKIEGTGPCDTI